MPSGRAALSWGLGLSLALHVLWLASAPQPRAHVRRAPPAHTTQLAQRAGASAASEVELVVEASSDELAAQPVPAPATEHTKPASAPSIATDAAATRTNVPAPVAPRRAAIPTPSVSRTAGDARASVARDVPLHGPMRAAPDPAHVRPRAQAVSAGPPLPAAEPIGRDLGALERTLKRIAATTELTQEERRKAMLVVLRTWEDPSRNESAEQLIKTLLSELRPGEDR